MNLNRSSAAKGDGMYFFPLLIAFFTASGKCLMKAISGLFLPDFPFFLLEELGISCADNAHRQMRWRQYFQVHDTQKNLALDGRCGIRHEFQYMKNVRWHRSLRDIDAKMDGPHFTRIIQFYYDELLEYPWMNPAVVSYYYGDTLLCKYDVFIKLSNSLDYIRRELDIYEASKYERQAVMKWLFEGNDFNQNPSDGFYRGDFLHWLRGVNREEHCEDDEDWQKPDSYLNPLNSCGFYTLEEIQKQFPDEIWEKVEDEFSEGLTIYEDGDDVLPF